MLVVLLVTVLKTIAHTLLLVFIPLQLITFILPPIVVDPVTGIVTSISSFFVWLFGYPVYSFFALPVYRLSLFIVHFIHRLKGFFR